MKYVTFFGGAVNEITPEYHDSEAIGAFLAENGYDLKCGGYFGLMEAVCKGASSKKGHIIGITCATFPTTKGNEYLNETIVALDLFDRLRYLIDDSSLFIVQKGGIGTLSEFSILLDIVRKKKEKPVIITFGEEWKNFISLLKNITSEKELESLKIYNFPEFQKYRTDIEKIL